MARRNEVKIAIDISKAVAKLTRFEKKMRAGGDNALRDIGTVGKAKAAAIMPRHTGILARNLHFKTAKGEGRVTVFVTDPFGEAIEGVPPVRYPGRGARSFQLVRYMHTHAGNNWHGQDPRFMITTRDYLMQFAPIRMRTEVSKIVAEINKS